MTRQFRALAPSFASVSTLKPRRDKIHEKIPAEGIRRGLMVKRLLRCTQPSIARCESALSAEHGGEDTLVLGKVAASRTCALRLAERDRLPLERGLNAGVLHVNREPEASHRIPVGHSTNGPVVEARIACGTIRRDDVLAATAVAEQAAADNA